MDTYDLFSISEWLEFLHDTGKQLNAQDKAEIKSLVAKLDTEMQSRRLKESEVDNWNLRI